MSDRTAGNHPAKVGQVLTRMPSTVRIALLTAFILVGVERDVIMTVGPALRTSHDVALVFSGAASLGSGRNLYEVPNYSPAVLGWVRPFVGLGLDNVKGLWFLLNLVSLTTAIILFATMVQREVRWVAWLLLVGLVALSDPLRFHLTLGQVQIFTLLCLALAMRGYLAGQHWWGGFWLAVAIQLKVWPVVLLLPFLRHREYKVLGGALLGLVLTTLSAFLAGAGLGDFLDFARQVLGGISTTSLPYILNRSLQGFLARLRTAPPPFEALPASWGQSEWHLPSVEQTGLLGSAIGPALFLTLVVLLPGGQRTASRRLIPLEIAALIPAVLALVPVSWTHYMILHLATLALLVPAIGEGKIGAPTVSLIFATNIFTGLFYHKYIPFISQLLFQHPLAINLFLAGRLAHLARREAAIPTSEATS